MGDENLIIEGNTEIYLTPEQSEQVGRLVKPLKQRAEAAEARVTALTEALAFAKSCIKSGEPWTETCEQIIDAALARQASPEQEGA